MYRIGVIGGMGPLATVEFYKRLILYSNGRKDNEHENIIVLNHATMPDRTECILNRDNDKFIEDIKKDFDILNKIGVEVVAIPCNTSHFFYDEMLKLTDINIINMIEETIIEAKQLGYKKVAVFSTLGTRNAKVYDRYANIHDIEVVDIMDKDAESIMDIIYKIKKTNELYSEDFIKLAKKYCKSDVLGIIACTELSLLDCKNRFNFIDACDILALRTLRKVNNEIRN